MDHTGHRERLRHRFKQSGLKGFSDHEVLELVLTYAIPRIDVNPLAHQLILAFGSLAAVLEASKEELMQIKGIGERAATLITLALPLMQRYEQSRLLPKQQFETFSALAAYCSTLFIGAQEEQFVLLCLDAKMQLTKQVLMNTGTADAVQITPRQVVREAIRCNAVSVAVCHNHPSGDPKPSLADMELTQGIRDALSMVGIKLVDHVVVGIYGAYSMLRNGLIDTQIVEDKYRAAEDYAIASHLKTEKKK